MRITYCGLGVKSESLFSLDLLTFVDVLFELGERFCRCPFSYFISAQQNDSCFWLMNQHILCCIFYHFPLDVLWALNVHGMRIAVLMEAYALIIHKICVFNLCDLKKWNWMGRKNTFDITWICSKGTSKLNDSL